MLDNSNSRSHSLRNAFLGVIVFLLCAGSVFGKAKHIGQLFLETGAPRSGAEIYVFSGTQLANLYSDPNGLIPLGNPVTTSSDGVYWFYADNGRYAIAEEIGIDGYRIIDPEVHVFDPGDPQALTATSEEYALTLTHVDSDEVETSSTIVLLREDGPEIEEKGPWRIHYAGTGSEPAPPRSFMLLYNTDLQKDAGGNETWAPRDIEDVCILFKTTAVLGTGPTGHFRYAVAPSGPADTVPVFSDAVNSTGPVNTPSSLLTVGEGLDENTRFFRNRYDNWVPFAFSTLFGAPFKPEPQMYGEVHVIDLDLGEFRYATSKGEPHPQVFTTAFSAYASAGEAFVKLADGVTVSPGDTMVTSAQSGCAEVDNSQIDVNRIIGWALEHSGETWDGYVFVILK
jgi:hypothetical protein